MNVIVSNELQSKLANIDVDIIKSINGSFEASELIEMFKDFFYSKMILDVTAIKQYKELRSYEELVKGLDADKIIFVLPEGSSLCTPNFLSKLISMGIYNFTTNLNGVKFLIKKSNTLKDVEGILKMASSSNSSSPSNNENNNSSLEAPTSIAPKAGGKTTVIGVKNVTEDAGASTLIYMMKKELTMTYGSDKVMAIEINKKDFELFNDQNMISTNDTSVKNEIDRHQDKNIILLDLNNFKGENICDEIIYLMEPSTIKLNALVSRNKVVFSKLVDQKVVLNKSLLLNHDISDFEKESGLHVFYNIPPLDERKRNSVINDFLIRLGLLASDSGGEDGSNRIFGLFRR